MKKTPILEPNWPADFIGPDLPANHCFDVLAGSYEIPYEPKSPPVILDLGANVGAFARWASVRWPEATIYCYEPHPGNFAKLERTVKGLNANVHLRNQAVLNKADKMTLTAGQFNCGEHSLCAEPGSGRPSVEVEVIDAATLPKADILKIDTEGAELAILDSRQKAGRLAEFSAVMLEYHAELIAPMVTKMLLGAGFKACGARVHSQHRGELKFVRADCVHEYEIEKSEPVHGKKATHFLSIIAFDSNITAATVDAVMKMQHEHRLWNGWKFHTGEGQVRSRNECMNLFLQKTPFSHMLFMDADIIARREHIAALRNHPEAAESIICGVYCKKVDRIEHVYNSLRGGNPAPNKLGLMEVAKGGTGFMQIPRVALERIMEKFPERFYHCDYEKDDKGDRAIKFSFCFHDIRIDRELGFMRDQSEDWALCELAREAGVKIYADVSTTSWDAGDKPCVLHTGRTLFPLRTELERLEAVDTIEKERTEFAKQIALFTAERDELKSKLAELEGKPA